jgi:hypothetical protein
MNVPHPHGTRAAQKATDANSVRVNVPLIGTVTLPPADELAFVGGIALLTALDIIEWPVGLVLTAGHILASAKHKKVVEDFGQALEAAG